VSDIVIQSHRGPYQVAFGDAFAGIESALADKAHLIIDSRVAEIYRDRLAGVLDGPSVLRVDASEASKSLDRFPDYVIHLIEKGIKRDHTLVAVGGGITQDITAFIAATLFRGVSWEFYPTTLLAQADSCIGSKSSINVGPYKNQLGTFTPPTRILISTHVLATLDEVDVRSGIGELIKVHIISGWEDTRRISADYSRLSDDPRLLAGYIRRSLEIKKKKIEADEFDRNDRLIMNYGHSFGHAVESATHYQVPHGIAVTLGMDLANFVSMRSGLTDRATYEELHTLLAANYRGFEGIQVPQDMFFSALARDKKNRGGMVSLILMRTPGDLRLERRALDDELRSVCLEFLGSLKAPTVSA